MRELRPVRELRAARGGVPPPGGEARTGDATTARAARARPRHARPRRVRARDGVQRDVRVGGARRGRPDALPRQAGRCTRVVGIVLLALLSRFDYHRLRPLAPMLLVGALALCIAVLVVAPPINGARRWFLARPGEHPAVRAREDRALHLGLRACSRGDRPPRTLGELMKPIGIVVAVFAGAHPARAGPRHDDRAVPRWSPASCSSPASRRVLLLAAGDAGARARCGGDLARALPAGARCSASSTRGRIRRAPGFQTVQAMIGIGSGGVTGSGLGEGVQKINYLPEAHTDMIFAVVGEELGLRRLRCSSRRLRRLRVGGLPHRDLRAATRSASGSPPGSRRSSAGRPWSTSRRCSAIAPLTGIPLPFVSYGGSSLVVLLSAVGVLLNIAVNERVVEARVRDRGRRDGRARPSGTRRRGSAARARRDGDVRRQSRPRRVAAGS